MNNTCHLKICDNIEIYRKVKFHIVGGKNKRNKLVYDFEYIYDEN